MLGSLPTWALGPFRIIASTNNRTIGTVRSVVRIFVRDFTWYVFQSGTFIGKVHGPDFLARNLAEKLLRDLFQE